MGSVPEIKNAIITSADINIDRDMFLCCWVMLDYGGATQGFGGRVLGGIPGVAAGRHESGGNFAATEIVGILLAAGVERWRDLPGKAVRAKIVDDSIVAVGHIIKDDLWYEPAVEFAKFRK